MVLRTYFVASKVLLNLVAIISNKRINLFLKVAKCIDFFSHEEACVKAIASVLVSSVTWLAQ